jgi:hypothetical protein
MQTRNKSTIQSDSKSFAKSTLENGGSINHLQKALSEYTKSRGFQEVSLRAIWKFVRGCSRNGYNACLAHACELYESILWTLQVSPLLPLDATRRLTPTIDLKRISLKRCSAGERSYWAVLRSWCLCRKTAFIGVERI